jgi:hypothetical protein
LAAYKKVKQIMPHPDTPLVKNQTAAITTCDGKGTTYSGKKWFVETQTKTKSTL